MIRPEVKICGITEPEKAEACVELGVDAIGCVFFEKSPRHLSIEKAGEVVAALSGRIPAVGVFVNTDIDYIIERVEKCGLKGVQLHGQEKPDLVEALKDTGVTVIKALFIDGKPELDAASEYNANAFLIECSKGPLPGGNATAWDFRSVGDFAARHSLVLAGGLCAENVREAIELAMPHALDLSSSVEESPGIKNISMIKALMEAVERAAHGLYGTKNLRRIF